MTTTHILEFPAKISPRLPGGRVHKVLINSAGVEIDTLAGYYGNTENKTVASFPHDKIKAVTLTPRRLGRYERCRVVYFDNQNQEQTIELAVVNSEVSGDEPLTRYVTQVLEQLKSGGSSESIQPLRLEFPVIRPTTKLLYGAGLFAGLLIWTAFKGSAIFAAISSFLLFASLVAIVIDAIRLHTGWHPLVKVIASIGAFALAFILFVTTIATLQILGVVR